jgi:hypothetical protein
MCREKELAGVGYRKKKREGRLAAWEEKRKRKWAC